MFARFFGIVILSLCAVFSAQAQSIAIGLSGPGYALSVGSGGYNGYASAHIRAPYSQVRSSYWRSETWNGGTRYGSSFGTRTGRGFDHVYGRGYGHGWYGRGHCRTRGWYGHRGW